VNPSYVLVGNASGIPIEVDVANSIGSAVPVKVLLGVAYTLLHPPGWPQRPGLTGMAMPGEWPGLVLAAGTTMAFLACEATALVAAGAGSYA
jgi:hypothetical protein